MNVKTRYEYAIFKQEVRGIVDFITRNYIINYNVSPLYKVIREEEDNVLLLKEFNDGSFLSIWRNKEEIILIPTGIIDSKIYENQKY